jgi:site-specific DNA recombinase
MPSTDGPTKRAILYARVSSDDQVRGYSLDQQIGALREWTAREGYEVLEEIRDEGWSGAYLERPGLDRVRDFVEAGGVGVVVAQDADRITRDPAHRAFLDEEFERFGTRLVALDDWGDDSHEGELLEYLKGWVSKGERLKIAERSRRGKREKSPARQNCRTSARSSGFPVHTRPQCAGSGSGEDAHGSAHLRDGHRRQIPTLH